MNQMSFLPTDHQTEYRPKVRDLPLRERPVNRLREVGPMSVSTTELLACLLQTPDALQQAQELMARFEGLPGLVNASETEITQVDVRGQAELARFVEKLCAHNLEGQGWAEGGRRGEG